MALKMMLRLELERINSMLTPNFSRHLSHLS